MLYNNFDKEGFERELMLLYIVVNEPLSLRLKEIRRNATELGWRSFLNHKSSAKSFYGPIQTWALPSNRLRNSSASAALWSTAERCKNMGGAERSAAIQRMKR